MSERTCSVEACDTAVIAKGLCSRHYARLRRWGDTRPDLPKHGRRVPAKPPPPRQRRPKGSPPPPCSVEGCEAPTAAKSYCGMHYMRWRKHGDPTIVLPTRRGRRQCSIDGCPKDAIAREMCHKHYKRWQVHGDPLEEGGRPTRGPNWHVDTHGYVVAYYPAHPAAGPRGRVYQHVAVMADHLGRPLYKGECVHHKNGVRSDNRIENLELWTRSHPPGQRVSELIAFAHEILERYQDDLQLWPEWALPSS